MPESRKIETTQIDERCPVCHKGWMRPNGIVPSPGLYEHQCTSCQYKQTYSVRYPFIAG